MRRTTRAGWLAMLLFAAGCGGGSSGPTDVADGSGDQPEASDTMDAGDDGGMDADDDGAMDADDDGAMDADDGGADADAMPAHTVIRLTAGGGKATSPGYEVRLSIGTPQPMGAATSDSNRVQVGPAAGVGR